MSYASDVFVGRKLTTDRLFGLFESACQKISKHPAPTRSWVYFVVRPSYPIATLKIGLCKGMLDKRLSSLQTGCPEKLVMVTAVLGHDAHEEMLHCIAAQNWMRGEWFRLDPDLSILIGELVTRGLSKAVDAYARTLVQNVDGYRGSEHHKFLKMAIRLLDESYPILAARWAIAAKPTNENRSVAKTLDHAQLISLRS